MSTTPASTFFGAATSFRIVFKTDYTKEGQLCGQLTAFSYPEVIACLQELNSQNFLALGLTCKTMHLQWAGIVGPRGVYARLKGRLKQLAEGASFGETIRLQLSLYNAGVGSGAFCHFLKIRMGATYDEAAAFVNWPPLPTNPTLGHALQLLHRIEGPAESPTLCAAVRAEDLPLVRRMLALGVDGNVRYAPTGSPLAIALIKGHDPMIQCLLAFGADGRCPSAINPLVRVVSQTIEDLWDVAQERAEEGLSNECLALSFDLLEKLAERISRSYLSPIDIGRLLSMPRTKEALLKSLPKAGEERKES